jgi:cell division protein FtsB
MDNNYEENDNELQNAPETPEIPQAPPDQPEPTPAPTAAPIADLPDPPATPAEASQSSSPTTGSSASKKVEKKPPSRFVRILRKILIGIGIAALIFLAGFLTDHFVRYQPLSVTLDETIAELEQANQTISDLEAQNTQLTNANRTANNEIFALEEELAAVKANALYYQVLVDVNTARIALFLEEIEGAQAALADTQDNLEALLPAIIEVDPELGLSLPRRLELIISGIARDPETSLIDLELFTKDLLELGPLLVSD